jgi:hypothetical protein
VNAKKSTSGKKSTEFYARFPFIGNNTFLIASFDKGEVGPTQLLRFQQINSDTKKVEFEDQLECIHAVITRISVGEYEKIMKDPDAKMEFMKKTVHIRSGAGIENDDYHDHDEGNIDNYHSVEEKSDTSGSEFIRDDEEEAGIKLELDEKFFAFKSWVEGIAEAGFGALQLQGELDRLTDKSIPIAQFLWRNLLRLDPALLINFILLIERECKVEGEYHKSSILANLEALSSIMDGDNDEVRDLNRIPFEKFPLLNNEDSDSLADFLLLMAELGCNFYDIEEYLWTYMIRNNPSIITRFLKRVQRKHAVKHGYSKDALIRQFHYILSYISDSYYIDYTNEVRTRDNETAKFVVDWLLLIAEVEPEYLFSLQIMEEFNKHKDIEEGEEFEANTIIHILTARPEFTEYPQYARLFATKNVELCEIIARNPGAIKFSEYIQLFTNRYQEVKGGIAANPNAVNLPEFRRLFDEHSNIVHFALAMNEKAANLPEYAKLFIDHDFSVRAAVGRNRQAVKFPEFIRLFQDPSFEVRRAALLNPKAKHIPTPEGLFPSEWGKDLKAILSHPNACNFPEYKLLFADADNSIRNLMADDPTNIV